MDYNKKANDFLAKTNTKMSISYKKHDYYFQDDTRERDIYTVKLENDKHSFTFTFGNSVMDTEKGIAPTEYGILACLEKYGYQDFNDFCLACGYDNDSIKAKKVYKSVKNEYDNITKLFNGKEMEMLREIQ